MRILVGHNFYQQPGGEDDVFAAETAMLQDFGHSVVCYSQHNDAIRNMSGVVAGFKTIWNRDTYRDLAGLLEKDRPDVCHFHNTFPLISPSAFYAAADRKVPVVLTLHNYRLLCPAAVMLRDGKICEECVGRRIPLPGVLHGCYRHSRPHTAGVAVMSGVHRLLNTWLERVDLYIALTEFARRKFVEGGLPAGKIVTKPNFIHPDPGCGFVEKHRNSRYALFVGRLSKEKGIETLLRAWSAIGSDLPLRIAGDGPLAGEVRQACQTNPAVTWLGRLTKPGVLEEMKHAHVLIFPSVWYESLPLTILEAFATGLPVLASRLGSMPELIEEGRTGLLFEPGSAEDLARTVGWMLSDGERTTDMRFHARREFERKYTRARNYELLLDCYRRAGMRQHDTDKAVLFYN